MFPATQTTHAPTGAAAPSLADIVREQTQGGRLIIQFLVDAMTGNLPNFKPCHRIDASGQLIKLQASPFAHIVLEYTDGGRLIAQFLLEAMAGRLPDFEDCHQIAAERLLAKIDPLMARALAEDNTPRRSREGAPLHTGAVGAADVGTALDEIVRQETNDGRDIVRFYADVMRGVLTGFKTHQRMDAADKLVSLSSDHTPCVPAPYHGARQPASDHDTVPGHALEDAAEAGVDALRVSRRPHLRLLSYGEEDYRRDRYGDKALVHIFGDDEAKSAANQAVLDYKVDQIEAQRAAVHSDHDTCQPYDPCPSCRVPDPPDDDSFGQHTYGYNALVYIYSDKATARVGYMGAMDHKEKLRLALIAADAHDPRPLRQRSRPGPCRAIGAGLKPAFPGRRTQKRATTVVPAKAGTHPPLPRLERVGVRVRAICSN